MAAAAVQQQPGLPAFAVSAGRGDSKDVGNTPADVRTVLNYYKPNEDGSPPHATYTDRPETYGRPVEEHGVTIHDVRGREADYSLDGNGFQFVQHSSAERDFADDDHIKAVYYPETEQLLKDVTGASRIYIFDHTIRREPPSVESDRVKAAKDAATNQRLLRGPVQRVHIDQSYAAALSRVPYHLPDEADYLLGGRVQIINVWRPVGRPVARDPLTVAEAQSVPDSDLVPTGLIYPERGDGKPRRSGETLQVRHNAAHRWFYKSHLSPDEVLLIKCFDSKTDGRARRVPHSAFVDPGASPDAPTRQSIEVRALVFHENDRE